MNTSPAHEDEKIRIVHEDKANLACYFVRSLLRRSSSGKPVGQLARIFERGVEVKAGGMTAFVYGSSEGLVVSPVQQKQPGITVEGDLNTLLGILLGGGAVWPYLRGEVTVRGNPFTALKMLGQLRIAKNRKG